MKIVITGRPGIGKTTTFLKVIKSLQSADIKVGGFICPEVRVGGVRRGFKIVDIMTGDEGYLAWICKSGQRGPRIGKYCVNVEDAIRVGVSALERAEKEAIVIGIDEVGPMELKVPALRRKIFQALESEKKVLAVVHWRLKNELGRIFRYDFKIFEITELNRGSVHIRILELLMKDL
jgi:nucleoside-triphosphatase